MTAYVAENANTVTAAKSQLESGVSGKVTDSYVSGVTIFADLNGDGFLNKGEASTITDDLGNFSLSGGTGLDNLIVTGGADISTGKPFEGTLTAPSGLTVVNPLTTLIDKNNAD